MEHEIVKALKMWKSLYRFEVRERGIHKFKTSKSTLIMGICKNGIVAIC